MIIRMTGSKAAGLAAAALLFAPAIQASNLDVYYVADSQFEFETDAFDSELKSDGGYGVKGQFHFTNQLFIAGEYQDVDYDEIEIDGLGSAEIDGSLETIRAGVGFHFLGESPLYVLGEYIRQESELDTGIAEDSDEQDGYGVHIGARDILDGGFGFYAQAGYLDVGDNGDGFEGLIGATFNFSKSFAVLADYRYTSQKGDDDVEVTIGDFRAGVRLLF